MPWFKVDDGFHSHPKIIDVTGTVRGREAIGLWAVAGSWCADNLTDGVVTDAVVKRLGWSPRSARDLVEWGLWDRISADRYCFHEWDQYQPSRSQVEQKRMKTNARVQKHRAGDRGCNAVTNAVTQAIDGPSARDPVPSRPIPIDPPTPLGLSPDRTGELYRTLSGCDDLSPDPSQWTPRQGDSVRQFMLWANRQPEPEQALTRELTLGATDDWLRAQPVHVWATRLGTMGRTNGTPARPSAEERRNDREDAAADARQQVRVLESKKHDAKMAEAAAQVDPDAPAKLAALTAALRKRG